jgi:hypothetical protein
MKRFLGGSGMSINKIVVLIILAGFFVAAVVAKDKLKGTVVAERDGVRVITSENTPDSTTNYVLWTTASGEKQHLIILCEVWRTWDRCIELQKGQTYTARIEVGKDIVVRIVVDARVGNLSRPTEFKSKVVSSITDK